MQALKVMGAGQHWSTAICTDHAEINAHDLLMSLNLLNKLSKQQRVKLGHLVHRNYTGETVL